MTKIWSFVLQISYVPQKKAEIMYNSYSAPCCKNNSDESTILAASHFLPQHIFSNIFNTKSQLLKDKYGVNCNGIKLWFHWIRFLRNNLKYEKFRFKKSHTSFKNIPQFSMHSMFKRYSRKHWVTWWSTFWLEMIFKVKKSLDILSVCTLEKKILTIWKQQTAVK